MVSEELYPELRNYIFDYCGKYFLQKEIEANRHLMTLNKLNKATNVNTRKFFQEKGILSKDKEVLGLVKDGFESFKINVTTRIWSEHKDELELNLCPKCKKIARTPWAKQCRFCFYDWH